MKKLKKVSAELANEILKSNGIGIDTYGCGCGSGSGSGSGCGCGSGSGSGNGSGSGSGSGDDFGPEDSRYWQPETTRQQALNIEFEDNYINEDRYRFILKASGKCVVHMYRPNHGAEWELRCKESSITFCVVGTTTIYRDPISGKDVAFTTEGKGSVTVKQHDDGYTASASLKCSTVAPQSDNYIIEARATFSVADTLTSYMITSKSLTGSISHDF